MRDGDRYRFNLQFVADTEDAARVGETLEKLGKHKSQIVIAAIVEYLNNHPDFHIERPSDTPRKVYRDEVERMIRAILEEKIAGGQLIQDNNTVPDKDVVADEIDADVMALLGNVQMFE